jgi:metal-responsive CopG/Arc/MetJ family transcriptional regulator
MKVAVSIPDELFDDAERAAQRLGCSRSKLFARALEAYLVDEATDDEVTARLDEIAAELETVPDPAFERAGQLLIDSGMWEW